MNDTERARCAVMASLLDASSVMSHVSLAVSVMGIVLMISDFAASDLSLICCALAAFVALPERYFAFRIRLDAGLFGNLASGMIASLSMLDEALNKAELRKHSTGPLRELDDRLTATRHLIKLHSMLVAGQSLALLVAFLLA